jgi:hypothetical protein
MLQGERDRLLNAINTAKGYGRFYCKFLAANDIGKTGAHQAGLHISKEAWGIFFDEPGIKGNNKDKMVKIHIDGFYPFDSRVIYYGRGTRNEYRITRFWTNSPYDPEQQFGNLIIFIPLDQENFKVFILESEDAIEEFTETFSLSLLDTNAVFENSVKKDTRLSEGLEKLVEEKAALFQEFPTTSSLAEMARKLYLTAHKLQRLNPDKMLLKWIETEYLLFHAIERSIYRPYLIEPFYELPSLLEFANTALNRRKSRAGRSLEHHMAWILQSFKLPFDNPGRTEGNKRPDFLFPSSVDYRNKKFKTSDLIFLGAKTTCKDRWRQILNEADRIPEKYLLTLQQGISKNQLEEMKTAKVTLVVPRAYHKLYPETHRGQLWTVYKFVQFLREKYK